MFDIITELYYLVDENLPVYKYSDDAERDLEATLSPERRKLFEDYQMEVSRRDDA